MQHIRTAIEILAPAERVWKVLTDFAAYASWNPFIRAVSGEPVPGRRLEVSIQPKDGKAMSFRPRLLVVNANQELRWKGRLLVPGVFDGEHYFQLAERGAGRVEFTQGEVFSGVLVPFLLHGRLKSGTEQGFESMNQALKRRAET